MDRLHKRAEGGDRVIVTHLNNMNPALFEGSEEAAKVKRRGFEIATEGLRIPSVRLQRSCPCGACHDACARRRSQESSQCERPCTVAEAAFVAAQGVRSRPGQSHQKISGGL